MFVYDYQTSIPKAPPLHELKGVAHRKLHVHENGKETLAVEIPGQNDWETTFTVAKDAKVQLDLTYVDDHGKESDVILTQKFTANGVDIPADAEGDFAALNKIKEREVEQWPEVPKKPVAAKKAAAAAEEPEKHAAHGKH